MVVLNKTKTNSSSSTAVCLIKLCFPIFVGIVIGFLLANITTTFDRSLESDIASLTTAAVTATTTPTTSIDVKTKKEGWNPVFVYYGKSDAINEKNAPLKTKSNVMEGSQVRQDKIIASLVATFRERIQTKPSTGRRSNIKSGNTNSKYDSRPPYFVDLAANDAISLSNTYNLEKLGFEGLCVEPNPVYWFRLAHRKCVVVGAFVGGNTDLKEVEVSLENKEYGGIVGKDFDNKRNPQKEKRFTVSIRTMFEQFSVPKRIDYLSLDVEGAEELIMKEFPFHLYTVSFVTIERPSLGLQTLMKKNGYLFVMLLVNWGETIWVHDSVLELLSMEEIKDVISKNKRREKPLQKGARYFDIKTGQFNNFV